VDSDIKEAGSLVLAVDSDIKEAGSLVLSVDSDIKEAGSLVLAVDSEDCRRVVDAAIGHWADSNDRVVVAVRRRRNVARDGRVAS
jgi:hypothetical protein